jgi:UDP-glucuronate decarboxylase
MYAYHTYTQPKRILVTGGAGFIGSHLCERLIRDGHEVICLDNFFTGRKKNISHLFGHPAFEFVRHDITQPILLEVDWIFNLACPASPIHYQYNPVKTIKVNVIGALNMLGMAKRVKARIMQASTSEVYGDPDVHPQTEEYWGNVNPIGKRSCYDEGKRVAETFFFDYLRQNKVDVKVVRIFNTYGPRMRPDDGRVVSSFIVDAIQGRDIEVYGTGEQTRSFCYIDDMLEGMIRMMDYETDGTLKGTDYTRPSLSGFPGPINLGNPEEVSIRSLAEKVIGLARSQAEIVFKKLPEDDPRRRCPDISKARNSLKWEPQVPLEEGLKKTIDYFRNLSRDTQNLL